MSKKRDVDLLDATSTGDVPGPLSKTTRANLADEPLPQLTDAERTFAERVEPDFEFQATSELTLPDRFPTPLAVVDSQEITIVGDDPPPPARPPTVRNPPPHSRASDDSARTTVIGSGVPSAAPAADPPLPMPPTVVTSARIDSILPSPTVVTSARIDSILPSPTVVSPSGASDPPKELSASAPRGGGKGLKLGLALAVVAGAALLYAYTRPRIRHAPPPAPAVTTKNPPAARELPAATATVPSGAKPEPPPPAAPVAAAPPVVAAAPVVAAPPVVAPEPSSGRAAPTDPAPASSPTSSQVSDLAFPASFGKGDMVGTIEGDVGSFATALRERCGPKARYILTGHTCPIGDKTHNVELGFGRARAVRALLAKQGLAAGAIAVKSAGSKSPIASNDSEEGRQKNRRVSVSCVAANRSTRRSHD